MQFSLALFGPMEVTWGGAPLTFPTGAARGLLAYLALEADRPHPREQLAALLWPDQSQATAYANLRQTLARVRRALPDPASQDVLAITPQTIQLRRDAAAIDVVRFEQLLAECAVHARTELVGCAACLGRLQQAAALYRGELLHGLFLPHSQAFDEWLLVKREELHREALEVLDTLARTHEAAGDYVQMRRYAARQLALDPWREQAHAQVMRALAHSGQHTAALAQYETCCRVLEDELGMLPSAETTALYAAIKSGKPLGRRGTPPPDAPKTAGPAAIRRNWNDVPETGALYGREADLHRLQQWLHDDRCRLVGVLGMGGVGKTALAATAVRAVAAHFDSVIWHSLVNAPPLHDIVRATLQILSGDRLLELPTNQADQQALLLDELRRQRCLLVFDNLESILEAGPSGAYRAGYEPYGRLIEQLVERGHRSCVLLTSRERPREVSRLADDMQTIGWLRLAGLDAAGGQAMLTIRGLGGQQAGAAALVERYSGNPLALRLVAETIQELFLGDIGAFLEVEAPIFDDIRTVLDQQYARLSPLEQEFLVWLAIEREPTSIPALRENLLQAGSPRDFMEALRGLQRRSLLEQVDLAPRAPVHAARLAGRPAESPSAAAFTLQNVIMEYVTARLVDDACRAIESEQLGLLNQYALLKAQAKEHVRQSQARLILQPIAERMEARLGRAGLEEHLRRLVATLRAQAPRVPGYAGGNLLNLLLHMEVELRGYDFSGLSVWQAYLRGMSLPEVDFSGADLAGSAVGETFGFTRSLALSPDGQWLAAGTDDGDVRLWQAASGEPYATYTGHSDRVTSVAFSPDGRTLASSSRDQTVRVWDVRTGHVVSTLGGHDDGVQTVAFSHDGRWLASGGGDQAVRLWDAAGGACVATLRGHTAVVMSIAFSPHGETLASGGADETVRLWDLATGQLCRTLEGHGDLITAVVFSPDGTLLASSSTDRTIRLWDTGSGQALHTLQGHTNWVWAVAFSPDGAILASASADRTIRLWDVRAGQAHGSLLGHADAVHSLAFSPDGQTLTSGGYDQMIRVWDLRTGQCLRIRQGHTQAVFAVAFSPDGDTLAGAGADGTIQCWDVRSRRRGEVLRGHTQSVQAVAFSPDGALLASGGTDQAVRLWDTRSGQVRNSPLGHTEDVSGVAFSPGGDLLASSSDDSTVRLWDARSGQALRTLQGHTNWVYAVAYNPDGQTLASAGVDRTIRLWDVRSGQARGSLLGHADMVHAVAFSSDGRTLASGSRDRTVRVWDACSGECLHILEGHTLPVRAVAFSPDGRTLASSGQDLTVRLWDAPSGACLHALHGHTRLVPSVAFSPDGQTLASGSLDETIRLWNVGSGACVDTLRAERPYAGMNITGTTGLTEAQRAALKALGAVEDEPLALAGRPQLDTPILLAG